MQFVVKNTSAIRGKKHKLNSNMRLRQRLGDCASGSEIAPTARDCASGSEIAPAALRSRQRLGDRASGSEIAPAALYIEIYLQYMGVCIEIYLQYMGVYPIYI